MLRLHLSSEDLLRTTLAAAPSPAWEITQSLRLLRRTGPAPRLTRWCSDAPVRIVPSMRPLLDLIPARSTYVPDFLTPPIPESDVDSIIDAVLSTPLARLRAELAPLLRAGLLPSRVEPLYSGDGDALRQLGLAIRAYHAELIAPRWRALTARVAADLALRSHQLATGGLERVLDTLDPQARWDTPTLSFGCRTGDHVDVRLHGRGLVLLPTVFTDSSMLMLSPEGPAVLAYPAALDDPTPAPEAGLVALLGRTRAAILVAAELGGSTTELARRVGVSVASASQHAGVLRASGLIATRRTGPAVRHTLTPLGENLLRDDRRTASRQEG